MWDNHQPITKSTYRTEVPVLLKEAIEGWTEAIYHTVVIWYKKTNQTSPLIFFSNRELYLQINLLIKAAKYTSRIIEAELKSNYRKLEKYSFINTFIIFLQFYLHCELHVPTETPKWHRKTFVFLAWLYIHVHNSSTHRKPNIEFTYSLMNKDYFFCSTRGSIPCILPYTFTKVMHRNTHDHNHILSVQYWAMWGIQYKRRQN